MACLHNRDKFLICLLYETGMRIGEALGLRHEDIHSWDNEVWVIPRKQNVNGVRAKTKEVRELTVSQELVKLYTDYLIYEFDGIDSDYVFVNIWDGVPGQPMTYAAVAALFRRLSKKTGIRAHPHMLRHTHATELLRHGMEAHLVQRRLGHASIQTTINTYAHLTNEDLKQIFKASRQRKL